MNDNECAVIASGYFDPLHVGHLDYLEAAAELGDVYVIVNNDDQARLKKVKSFMPERERLRIVMAICCVDGAGASIDNDATVIRSITKLHGLIKDKYNKIYFAKGGDSTKDNVPEQAICDELGIEILWDVGGAKVQSSSWLTGLKPRYHV